MQNRQEAQLRRGPRRGQGRCLHFRQAEKKKASGKCGVAGWTALVLGSAARGLALPRLANRARPQLGSGRSRRNPGYGLPIPSGLAVPASSSGAHSPRPPSSACCRCWNPERSPYQESRGSVGFRFGRPTATIPTGPGPAPRYVLSVRRGSCGAWSRVRARRFHPAALRALWLP